MSGWRSPPIAIPNEKGWFWNKCINFNNKYSNNRNPYKYNLFEVQEYVDPLGCIIRTVKNYEPSHYRIVLTVRPQKEVAFANTREKIEEMWLTLNNEVSPQLAGFSPAQIHSVLPSLIQKLHNKDDIKPMLEDWAMMEDTGIVPTDLTGIVEGLKKDNLEISVTFEYTYKEIPPLELCCNTCHQPAIDPHVSPLFPGKLYCASCVMFELGGKLADGSQKLAYPAPGIAALLDKLEVYCPFAKFGCEMSLPRGALHQHLEECPHVCIICVNRSLGCDFGAKTKAEAIEHMSSCQYSSAICRELTESYSSSFPTSPPMYPSLPHARLHQNTGHTSDGSNNGQIIAVPSPLGDGPSTPRCKHCFVAIKEGDNIPCKYHIGTWHGFTYEQIQTWQLGVWKHRVSDSLKCIVHYPLQIAKSSSVVGVSVFAFRALLSPQYMLMFGGLLLVLPAWIKKPIMSTLLSPRKLYRLLYKYPYNLIYGKSDSNIVSTDGQKWTCCGQAGLYATPCACKGYHEYD
jgi:hypothetical protein